MASMVLTWWIVFLLAQCRPIVSELFNIFVYNIVILVTLLYHSRLTNKNLIT